LPTRHAVERLKLSLFFGALFIRSLGVTDLHLAELHHHHHRDHDRGATSSSRRHFRATRSGGGLIEFLSITRSPRLSYQLFGAAFYSSFMLCVSWHRLFGCLLSSVNIELCV
jgi:hypothetical protein